MVAAGERGGSGGLVATTGPSGRDGLASPTLDATGAVHRFTLRGSAPTSDPGSPGAALDRHALATDLGRPAATVVTLRQVHGTSVFDADGDLPPSPPTADAAVTSRADRIVLVRTADCVPVLLAREDGRLVAAVHAGWRGLVAGVLEAAVAVFDGARLVAAIGPCLSREHFEVGPEVVAAFRDADLARAVHPPTAEPGPKAHVDLRAAAALVLRRCGAVAVDGCRVCTWDDPRLYSHRRDVTHGGAAATGRQAAAISPQGAPWR